MKNIFMLMVVAGALLSGTAFADPVIGTWKLNVEKSKFAPGGELTAGTRTYTESAGLYTLDQTLTGKDGKERSGKATYRNGQEVKQASSDVADTTLAKKIDANTWDFELKKGGKTVGHVHRVVSTDGKTLTVHNSGAQLSGAKGDETLVFDKQ
jgi:hypothetical protein